MLPLISRGFDTNKFLVALTMIIVNLGSRYVITDMTPLHEMILSHTLFKRLVIFCMFFLVTRDVIVSLCMTAAFLLVFNVLLHEDSKYCVVPASLRLNAVNKRAAAREEWERRMVTAQQRRRQRQSRPLGHKVQLDDDARTTGFRPSDHQKVVTPDGATYNVVAASDDAATPYGRTAAAVQEANDTEQTVPTVPDAYYDPYKNDDFRSAFATYDGGGKQQEEMESDNSTAAAPTFLRNFPNMRDDQKEEFFEGSADSNIPKISAVDQRSESLASGYAVPHAPSFDSTADAVTESRPAYADASATETKTSPVDRVEDDSPKAYTSGGLLYEDNAESENNDITRSSSLAFINFAAEHQQQQRP